MLEPLENLLNAQLAASPRARALTSALRGQALHVEILELGWRFSVDSAGDSLRLQIDPEGIPVARLAGRPFALLALVAGPATERVLQSGEVRIEGDAEVLQRYRELLGLLRPDLEEWLAERLGDAPARQIGSALRAVADTARRGIGATVTNTAEYFAHETGHLVPRGEAEEFLNAVDRLREDLDRTAARVEAIAARMAETST